jgi:hypothetical protein
MRGEVILLTRSIVIQGDMTENDWHGQFLTTDTMIMDSNGGMVSYQGLTILNYVEFAKMG